MIMLSLSLQSRKSKIKSIFAGLVVVSVILVLFGTVSSFSPSIRILSATSSALKTASLPVQPVKRKQKQDNNLQHLVRGDLPEYVPTQKALDSSKAHLYNITSSLVKNSPMLHPWSVTVSCNKECADDTPHFYMRAYGASVATGQRRTYQGEGGTIHHEFTFLPTDLGSYTVEVVMTFSNAPDYHLFPLPLNAKETEFEGILLPGFPVRMISHDNAPKQEPGRQCTQADIAWPSPYSPESTPVARWKLVSKSGITPSWPTQEIEHFVEPPNMLGMKMEYQHLDCKPLTDQQVTAGLRKMVRESVKPIRIILFGDSVMNLQEKAFRKMAAGIPSIRITSFNGNDWHSNANVYPDALAELLKAEEHRLVVFNYGLHSVYHSCSKKSVGTVPCGEQHRSRLFEILKTMHLFPADVKIFQTTTAAWPLYGNFNIPGDAPTFSTSPEMVRYFNEIALETVREFNQNAFVVTDGYTMTASRPDNRQVFPKKLRMLNPGQEVVAALTREWVTIIIDAMKNGGNIKLAVLRKRPITTPGRVMVG